METLSAIEASKTLEHLWVWCLPMVCIVYLLYRDSREITVSAMEDSNRQQEDSLDSNTEDKYISEYICLHICIHTFIC